MNTENEAMLSLLETVNANIAEIKNLALSLEDPAREDFSKSFSNTDLLIKTLNNFYNDSARSEYLPKPITKQINTNLTDLNASIAQFKTNPQSIPLAEKVITAADSCYAHCLQYGLISFGFDTKVKQELIDELRGIRKRYGKIISDSEIKLKELEEKLTSDLAAFKEPITTDVNKLHDNVKSIIDTLTTEIHDAKAAHEELINEINIAKTLNEGIANTDKETKKTSTEVTALATTLKSEFEKIQTLAIDVKTNVEQVRENRSAIKQQLDEIKDFFSEIEAHEKKMTDIKKESNENINKLTAAYEEDISGFKEATDNIITTNQDLQKEIKDHLTKAIGASLFSAFDTRRESLKGGKTFWSKLLILTVLSGILLTLIIALTFKDKPDAAFYVKLSAILPIAFLIGFSAKQYSNERRAEEEYAFKSTISISLEPYRDLLYRMRSESPDTNTDFIEELIYEIFDNPVKRIYSGKSSESVIETTTGINTRELLEKVIDKFPADQVKDLKELIGKLIELSKIKK